MNPSALAALAATITSSIVASSLPNKIFSLIDVANRAGSWLTNPICPLNHFNFNLLISTPSSNISPPVGSLNLCSNAIIVDFPEPLSPIKATVFPAGSTKLNPAMTSVSGLVGYLNLTSLNSTSPLISSICSPSTLSESITGLFIIVSLIRSAAATASP
ncbi:hypothetical protein IEQ34_013112 [Dendrobium chrysotoxum]|uniref:Secreted protein n=1 Tax=Dendrobium chrysotoxum TaxID=161865 RepID=A0AAV7GND1_DENCH|nr:hypothetical protein IEQ34_013112 [Dendrobium chrysotoxum]